MSGTDASTPYRDPTLSTATYDELVFWGQVYAAATSAEGINKSSHAASWADEALEQRRKRFGVR